MKTLILQCCETEDLGLYIDVLADLGVRHDIVQACRELIPPVKDYGVLMIGGTPDAAYWRAEGATRIDSAQGGRHEPRT